VLRRGHATACPAQVYDVLSYPCPCCCVLQARHRRIRRWDVLWAVYDYALKYRQLKQRKALRRRAYEAALQPRPDGSPEVRCTLQQAGRHWSAALAGTQTSQLPRDTADLPNQCPA
jgi:hypothetical protein